jgi:beta-lactamase regulating signal transducer with metallopeptidase domain
MNLTALFHLFNAVADRAADIAVTALWQGVLIAGLLAICIRIAPRVSAAYRFAVWGAAFAVLFCLSVFSFVPQFSAGAAHAVAAHMEQSAARPWLSLDARWSLAIAVLWLGASLYRAADLAIHSVRLRKLWRDAKPVLLDERVVSLLRAAEVECGRGPVEVCTTTTLQRPSVIGFLKPRILVPDWLYARLTRGELEQIVLHEAEHLRRRDDWTNLAQKLCLVVFPLNAALVWIEHRLCREREMACDDGVIRVTRAPRAYAACLASLAERGLERRVEALSLGAWQRRPELVHRVHSILRGKRGLSPIGARMLLGTLGCGLLAGSVELAQSPQLVAFVPSRSVVATNQAENLNVANTATKPVQIASLDRTMAPSIGRRAVSGASLATSSIATASERSNAMSELSSATNVTLRQPAESQIAAVPLMAKSQRHSAGKPQSQQAEKNQQWVVLTEWEQVETSGDHSSLRRDYDLDSNSAVNDGAPASPEQRGAISVTQLIFRILPAQTGLPANEAPSADAHSSQVKPASSFPTSQPGIATFRDGWLVLQL